MKQTIWMMVLVSACAPVEQTKLETNDTGLAIDTAVDDTEDTENTEDTSDTQDTSDTEDTQDTSDTEPPRIVAQEGTWDVRNVQLIEDACGLGNYEDVTGFVPTEFEVTSSDETGFNLDAQTRCDVDEEYQIMCDGQDLEQDVLGGTATFMITNRFQGELEAVNDIGVDFNIQIVCDGFACGAIELGLSGGFPCDVILYANAQPN